MNSAGVVMLGGLAYRWNIVFSLFYHLDICIYVDLLIVFILFIKFPIYACNSFVLSLYWFSLYCQEHWLLLVGTMIGMWLIYVYVYFLLRLSNEKLSFFYEICSFYSITLLNQTCHMSLHGYRDAYCNWPKHPICISK